MVEMFHSTLLCSQPTGTSNAETLHSGILAPPIARNASTQTLAQMHRLRILTNMVVASRGAKPPIHVEFKMVVASHVVFIQRPASCPRLRQEYGPHQRTHPPQFATRQASPLSNVVAHRWQTKVATRLNRVKMTNRKKTNSINAEGKCLPCVCSVSCATLGA